MAIYQGNQGRGIVGGANAVFDSINQASQRYAEARQAKRNEEFISSLKGQGLLGVKANELIDPTTGKIKLGAASKGFITDVKGHYDKVSGTRGMKDLKRVFGRNATADDVKDYITGVARKRDQEIGQAITRRMGELDTENIWKVVDKGDEAFKAWYNSTDEATRKQLRDLGYHPDQREIAGLPDFMEKRVAQGKSNLGYGIGAAAGAYGASKVGRYGYNALLKSGNADIRKIMRDEIRIKGGPVKREIERRLKNAQEKLSKVEGTKRATKYKRSITKYQNELAKMNKQFSTYIPDAYGGQGAKESIRKATLERLNPVSTKARKIATGKVGRGVGRVGRGVLGYQAGSLLGGALGGETGEAVGGTIGAFTPEIVSGLSKTKAGKSLLTNVAKRIAMLAPAALADSPLLPFADIAVGVGGIAWGVHDYLKQK